MQIILAPMEGVIDYRMRKILTAIGGYDRCVTEFIRVSDRPIPARVFRRLCPELEQGGCTASGVPVYLQLLGGDPGRMAESAKVAERAGAAGIDLNFGCPAKVVNRHDGGSILLQEPERVGDIVRAVRDRVDPAIPVCAKIRLGFDHTDLLHEVVDEIHMAGASELCIHARTRKDGYKPPAFWSQVGTLPRPGSMKLIINGEIWNTDQARSAIRQSGCPDLMIGRGGLACPDLARIIRSEFGEAPHSVWEPLSWAQVAGLVEEFFRMGNPAKPKYTGNRTKQWLGYLQKQYPEAGQLFSDIKRLRDGTRISEKIAACHNTRGQQPTTTRIDNTDIQKTWHKGTGAVTSA